MSKVGNSEGQQNQWAAGYSCNDGFEQPGRSPGQSGEGRSALGTRATNPFDASTRADGVAAFQRSFHRAFRDLGDAPESSDDGSESTWLAQASLLAIAEQGPQAGLPCPTGTEAPADGRSAEVEAAVSAMMACILRTIRAEAGGTGQSFELSLAFAGEMASELGVRRISLSGTATTLDVVLERAGSEDSVPLREAARLLAERLMTRFGKRTVRVLDLAATGHSGEPVEASAHLGEP